jgi:hypothetical protein
MCQYNVVETIEHLFFDCPFAVCRWFGIGFVWEENLNIHQKLYQAKRDFGQPFFMEVFMIGAWCLWNQRNEVIFDRKAPCLAAWKVAFKAQVLDHLVTIKLSLHSSIKLWLQAS